MREAMPLIREQKGLDGKRKYYIIPEGEHTEIKYFKGIEANREELNINSLVEVRILTNDITEKGNSNPLLLINNFEKDLKCEKFEYYPNYDKVCFIVDRDCKSFTEEQFDEFVKTCKAKDYRAYITNPCFEFFLLMHSNDVFSLDRDEIKENPKVNANKRFLEKKVSEIFYCNPKSHMIFAKFKPYIRNAIENEKSFCEDISGLKKQVGSNVGLLLEELIGDNAIHRNDLLCVKK